MRQQSIKVRENRLRHTAERQGLKLLKSRSRDQYSLTFGTYMLTDITSGLIAIQGNNTAQQGYGLDLDDIEKYLTTPHAERGSL